MLNFSDEATLFGVAVALMHLAGIVAAVDAVMDARSPQGSIAWALGLFFIPYLSLPVYALFGRRRFRGYIDARRGPNPEFQEVVERLLAQRGRFDVPERPPDLSNVRAIEKLARMPFTYPNRATLLIDGEATFASIFESVAAARGYVLVQFFIIHDDRLGRELARRLAERARAGVRVFLIYDEVGCHALPRAYLRGLEEAGVEVRPFGSTRGRFNRLQINFRNHRKVVLVDGRVAFLGGHNVGDEYMGRDPAIGPWRDTHCRIEGPAVQGVQLSFVEDWHWAAREIPELLWEAAPAKGGASDVLIVPTGPADGIETCALVFIHAINVARKRIWIASPYFVPGAEVLMALSLAALRGVDVRIILPERPDHLLTYLAGFSYLEELCGLGIRVYRYREGFMHQKVLLVDEFASMVGTANFDNRSFRLNFEITAIILDARFASEVEAMLEDDMAR